mmetsp:Transcript_21567/g.56028  ORF Transcript_21567/g.56028 Transcript_21567/m.56028 type:complete len:88 (+) Transcript_21567:730-993(+)
MVPTLLRDAPFSGVYASSFSYMKEKLPVILPENCSPFYALAAKFSCGVISGALATLITQPADVIRTQVQVVRGSFTTSYKAYILTFY